MKRPTPLPAFASLAAALLAPAVLAAPRETVSFNAVDMNGVLNSPANQVRNFTAQGGYALGRLTFTGTLTSVTSGTWRTDSRILVTSPGGAQAVLRPFLTGTTYTALNFSGELPISPGENPAGSWTFRFFEAFDDGGTSAIDARMSIAFTYDDAPPAPPTAVDLGVLTPAGATTAPLTCGTTNTPGFRWYRFQLSAPVSVYNGRFLDLDSFGSVLPETGPQLRNDTQCALYSGQGQVLATDDDSCDDLLSQLSFGAGGRPAVGDGQPFDGTSGSLPPGVYYVALGGYPLEFSPYWRVLAPLGSRGGTIVLRARTNASSNPCPADFNYDGIADFFDYLDFVAALEAEDPAADFNHDQIVDFFDYLDFVSAVETGC